MNMHHRMSWLAASAALLALVANTHAAGLPTGLPQAFDWTGPIDVIRLADDTVVINDRQYVLSIGARLHGASGRASLKTGTTVGVISAIKDNKNVIQDLWVLPDGYQAP